MPEVDKILEPYAEKSYQKAIAKYTKKAAIDTESEINNSPKPIELPDLKEIPEPRQHETTMEIL